MIVPLVKKTGKTQSMKRLSCHPLNMHQIREERTAEKGKKKLGIFSPKPVSKFDKSWVLLCQSTWPAEQREKNNQSISQMQRIELGMEEIKSRRARVHLRSDFVSVVLIVPLEIQLEYRLEKHLSGSDSLSFGSDLEGDHHDPRANEDPNSNDDHDDALVLNWVHDSIIVSTCDLARQIFNEATESEDHCWQGDPIGNGTGESDQHENPVCASGKSKELKKSDWRMFGFWFWVEWHLFQL